MAIIIFATILCLLISLVADKQKTLEGLKHGLKMFLNLLPALLTVLFLVSVFLYLVPEKAIMEYLGTGSGFPGVMTAALVGSISLIPGFVAFPMAGILVSRGVSYTVVAVFITSLMMVGIITLPLEIKYFGKRAAIMRNALSFFGAMIVGLMIGLFL